ncbi:origin recognition complex subunit 3 isoform X2 [Anoplophora glabripennis]|nr:origin recognition complex subunit 3 isoform X2 [Anoplophora glabripennis]
MPDHGAQFLTLSKQIQKTISPHVACLSSQNCQSIKYLMEHMINQFINKGEYSSDEGELLVDETKVQYKKTQLTLPVLKCWYEDLYKEKPVTSPKKIRIKNKRKVLVVIIPDFESFNSQVLQKFILIISWYIKVLPFVFVLGIATSLTTLHMSLPYQVSSKISVQVFNSQPSTVYLNNILDDLFFTLDCPFQLGGKVFNLFTDIFLFYDLSVNNFIQNIKYAMAEHFCYGNAMALCSFDKKKITQTLTKFSHEDFENVRRLISFRKLVENESYENRIKLLTDDEYLKIVLEEEINKIIKYIRRLHIFLKCLLIMVEDLPKAPLGKQVRELYSVTVSKNISKTPEYKECFQLLGFQSKEELSVKLSKVIDYLSPLINSHSKQNKIKDFVNQLNTFLNNMNNFNMNDIEEAVLEIENEDNVITGQMDRKQLKEKLLRMSKQTDKPLNKYERIRKDIIQCIKDTMDKYLIEPNTFYFHEIFFFNNISIQNYIIGAHRSAIHNALNDPHYYLQCASCCEIPNNSAIKLTMPDICIAYKLHLECGKMINLYDWLQAFLSILDPADVDNESRREVNPELQARFTQAVAELEYLGFVKSSKRKADHVTRLTWGG